MSFKGSWEALIEMKTLLKECGTFEEDVTIVAERRGKKRNRLKKIGSRKHNNMFIALIPYRNTTEAELKRRKRIVFYI